MKRILNYLTFFSEILTAIVKGFQETANNWPNTNPFSSGNSGDSAPLSVDEQQSKPDKSSGNIDQPLEETEKVPNRSG